MKKTLLATVVAASLGVVSVAAAADFSGFQGKGSGAYIGANVGYATAAWKVNNEAIVDDSTIKNKSGLTYGLDVGYMFNVNLGAELDYDFYGDQKINDSTGTQVAKIKNQAYPALLAVFNVPLNQQWNAFAKLGSAYLTPKITNSTDTNTSTVKYKVWAPELVVGGSYDIMPNLSLNAQVKYIAEQKDLYKDTRTTSDSQVSTPNYTALTVGVNYMF